MKLTVKTNGILCGDIQKHNEIIGIIEETAPHVFRHVRYEVHKNSGLITTVTLIVPKFLCGNFYIERIYAMVCGNRIFKHDNIPNSGWKIPLILSTPNQFDLFHNPSTPQEELKFTITKREEKSC